MYKIVARMGVNTKMSRNIRSLTIFEIKYCLRVIGSVRYVAVIPFSISWATLSETKMGITKDKNDLKNEKIPIARSSDRDCIIQFLFQLCVSANWKIDSICGTR